MMANGDLIQLLVTIGNDKMFENDFLVTNLRRLFKMNVKLLAFYMTLHSMQPKEFDCEAWVVRYEETMFYRMFRLVKKSFYLLTEVIGRTDEMRILSKKYSGGHHALDLKSHVLIFLWFMATGDSLISIGDRFQISPTIVMNVVNKVLFFMLKLKSKYIIFPRSQELFSVAQGFSHYPGTAGAIDGTHIFVKLQKEQQDSYIDRYRRHSINLMAICESNRLFTYVFIGFPGSAHDSRVFQNSSFYQQIELYGPQKLLLTQNFHLIGDSALGLKTWLMTSYKGNNLTRKQKRHNYLLSLDRVVIKHAFGLLKGRWRRVQFINVYNICKAIEITTSACVLHHFCIRNKDLWDEIAPIDYQEIENNEQDEAHARTKRDHIADIL